MVTCRGLKPPGLKIITCRGLKPPGLKMVTCRGLKPPGLKITCRGLKPPGLKMITCRGLKPPGPKMVTCRGLKPPGLKIITCRGLKPPGLKIITCRGLKPPGLKMVTCRGLKPPGLKIITCRGLKPPGLKMTCWLSSWNVTQTALMTRAPLSHPNGRRCSIFRGADQSDTLMITRPFTCPAQLTRCIPFVRIHSDQWRRSTIRVYSSEPMRTFGLRLDLRPRSFPRSYIYVSFSITPHSLANSSSRVSKPCTNSAASSAFRPPFFFKNNPCKSISSSCLLLIPLLRRVGSTTAPRNLRKRPCLIAHRFLLLPFLLSAPKIQFPLLLPKN
ncbi:uncharacterized protein [Primulina eburnea]|uniref:uncharacterized protein n=1 Tax=Primulina eburnea TaxID=1245227 RepID=UPI003C6C3501